MKRIVSFILAVLLLSSCTAQKEDDRFFCKKLGFDMADGKIYITARLSSPGKSSPEGGKDKTVTRVADSCEKAAEILEAEFDSILFKPLEAVIFGQGIDKDTLHELMARMANMTELQLKCNIYRAPSAKKAITNGLDAAKNEGVSFSRFFRNMTERKEK